MADWALYQSALKQFKIVAASTLEPPVLDWLLCVLLLWTHHHETDSAWPQSSKKMCPPAHLPSILSHKS